ncbi:MAG: hypothetical protein WCH77_14330 [Planctomycetota bacterium]
MAINPDATIIPDKAEVWLALESTVSNISSKIPSSATATAATLSGLGWSFCGLIDDAKGIPLDPAVEVKPYDAFGHPQFRVKLRKGTLKTGFTLLENNSVTSTVVLPGSAANKIGIPSDVQVYVLYRFVDDDTTRVWVSLRPAPIELTAHGGIVDGELAFAEMMVHHTSDANNDVFQVVGGSGGGVGGYTSGSTA